MVRLKEISRDSWRLVREMRMASLVLLEGLEEVRVVWRSSFVSVGEGAGAW